MLSKIREKGREDMKKEFLDNFGVYPKEHIDWWLSHISSREEAIIDDVIRKCEELKVITPDQMPYFVSEEMIVYNSALSLIIDYLKEGKQK